jgi:hypothetical protein
VIILIRMRWKRDVARMGSTRIVCKLQPETRNEVRLVDLGVDEEDSIQINLQIRFKGVWIGSSDEL